jgi:hydrogenase maturation protease
MRAVSPRSRVVVAAARQDVLQVPRGGLAVKILAFALGNAIRADDGAGVAVARGLDALVPGLEIVEVQELLHEHAEQLAAFDGVLFLDTSVAGTPGEVRASRLVPRPAREAILHALTPEEVLGLVHARHGRAPPAALVTIAGRDFAFGEALSPEVEAALPLAREKAREMAAGF